MKSSPLWKPSINWKQVNKHTFLKENKHTKKLKPFYTKDFSFLFLPIFHQTCPAFTAPLKKQKQYFLRGICISVGLFYLIFNAYQRLLPLRREGLFSV